MSEEEKKAIYVILYPLIDCLDNTINQRDIDENFKEECTEEKEALEIALNLIDKQQTKIDKKDKIINDMAIDLEYINKEILDEYDKLPYAESKQKIIDYFTNKIEEDIKE